MNSKQKYKQIITEIDDVDFYKITMLYVIFKEHSNVKTKWSFYNRGNHKFPEGFGNELRKQINNFSKLKFEDKHINHLRKIAKSADKTPLFDESFYTFLRGFKYNPNEVKIIQNGNDLDIEIEGLWTHTMFYETQIMATIVELYNLMTNKKYESLDKFKLNNLDRKKFDELRNLNIKFADFGMRRRAFKSNQKRIIDIAVNEYPDIFVGTSNVMFSRIFNCKAIGTTAHERTMVLATKFGPVCAYEEELKTWVENYKGNLGIALPDAYGTKKFLLKFNTFYSKLYDGVRQDSGDPLKFTDWMIEHYKNKGIDSKSKTIVYSDSINNIDKIKEIVNYRKGEIKKSFGIGTWITNDIPGIKPLNIVVKVSEAKFDDNSEWKHCVKISDDNGKYTYKDKKTLNWYINELKN